jgi:hypothetical protein
LVIDWIDVSTQMQLDMGDGTDSATVTSLLWIRHVASGSRRSDHFPACRLRRYIAAGRGVAADALQRRQEVEMVQNEWRLCLLARLYCIEDGRRPGFTASQIWSVKTHHMGHNEGSRLQQSMALIVTERTYRQQNSSNNMRQLRLQLLITNPPARIYLTIKSGSRFLDLR